MTNTFSQKQREKLVEFVQEARNNRERELLRGRSKDVDAVCREMAKEAGCLDTATRAIAARISLERDERSLRGFGFDVDDSGKLRLYHGCPVSMDKTLADRVSALDDSKHILGSFDLAILDLWTTETAAEAKRIVEDVLSK